MTIEEKRRELFEKCLTKSWPKHLVDFMHDGDRYVFSDINSAWQGFNAALDAVEIELPCSAETGGEGIDACRAAIESTGLGLKVK